MCRSNSLPGCVAPQGLYQRTSSRGFRVGKREESEPFSGALCFGRRDPPGACARRCSRWALAGTSRRVGQAARAPGRRADSGEARWAATQSPLAATHCNGEHHADARVLATDVLRCAPGSGRSRPRSGHARTTLTRPTFCATIRPQRLTAGAALRRKGSSTHPRRRTLETASASAASPCERICAGFTAYLLHRPSLVAATSTTGGPGTSWRGKQWQSSFAARTTITPIYKLHSLDDAIRRPQQHLNAHHSQPSHILRKTLAPPAVPLLLLRRLELVGEPLRGARRGPDATGVRVGEHPRGRVGHNGDARGARRGVGLHVHGRRDVQQLAEVERVNS